MPPLGEKAGSTSKLELKAGIDAMVEAERAGMRDDPEQEAKVWLEQLSEIGKECRGYLRLAAKGSITDVELDEALAELEDTRQTAEKALQSLQGRQEAIEQLEHDRDALLTTYAQMAPAELDRLDAAERHQVYKMLRLKVVISPDGALEVSGASRDCFVSEDQGACPRLAQDGCLLRRDRRDEPLRR